MIPYCESVRGEWGSICPDCGQRLPERHGPLASWQSQRPGRWMKALTDARWSPESRAKREATFRGVREHRTERQLEVLRIVEKHGGNRAAAARELGVSNPTMVVSLNRLRAMGYPVPAPSRRANA